jgi:hypothetical protein
MKSENDNFNIKKYASSRHKTVAQLQKAPLEGQCH